MNERTHFFIKIYLSHFIREGLRNRWCWLCVRGELGRTATYWPKVSLTVAALLSHSGWAAQPWVTGGHKPSVCKLILTLASCPSWLQLQLELNSNWLTATNSIHPGYIIVWHPPTSCGRTHLHRIQPCPQVKGIFRYLRPDAPVLLIYTGASLDWRLGRGSICYKFLSEQKLFWIKCFPFPRLVSKIIQSALFSYSWALIRCIYSFPKGISSKGNVNSLAQDLDFGHRFHFLSTITVTLSTPHQIVKTFVMTVKFASFAKMACKRRTSFFWGGGGLGRLGWTVSHI